MKAIPWHTASPHFEQSVLVPKTLQVPEQSSLPVGYLQYPPWHVFPPVHFKHHSVSIEGSSLVSYAYLYAHTTTEYLLRRLRGRRTALIAGPSPLSGERRAILSRIGELSCNTTVHKRCFLPLVDRETQN